MVGYALRANFTASQPAYPLILTACEALRLATIFEMVAVPAIGRGSVLS